MASRSVKYPIVQALVKEGDPAVEPLLAAFETDDRRTRSVQFWRDFARQRDVLTTYEAAYDALSGILDMAFFEAASTGDNLTARGATGRKAMADRLRAYWKTWRGVPIEERWYRMLADDKRDAPTWLLAARKLVQRTNVSSIPSSSIDQYTLTTPLAPGQQMLRGERLRTKTSPSVTALFQRRLPQMTEPGDRAMFLLAFARWDSAVAKPELARFFRESATAWSQTADHPLAAGMFSALTDARVDAGDPDALADYAAWIVTTTPHDIDAFSNDLFEPMIAHVRDPAIARAAAAMFGDPASRWLPLPSDAYDLMGTDLDHDPTFRALVLSQLANHKKLGVAAVHADYVELEIDGGSEGSSVNRKDPLAAPAGTTFAFRVADRFADELGFHAGVKFERYWRLADRDRAIAAIAAWLRTQ